ncbi:MAG: hypothetical protein ABSB82_14660 [Terriglobia bacterium]
MLIANPRSNWRLAIANVTAATALLAVCHVPPAIDLAVLCFHTHSGFVFPLITHIFNNISAIYSSQFKIFEAGNSDRGGGISDFGVELG